MEVDGGPTAWHRRLPLAFVALLAVVASLVVIFRAWDPASSETFISRRSELVVDLSWTDTQADLLVAPAAQPVSLIELDETDATGGTHELHLGHGGVQFGITESESAETELDVTELGGQEKVPVLNADELMTEADPRDDGANTTFFVCHQHHDIANLDAMHITKVEPIVTRVKNMNFDGSVVHHMSIFLCTDEEAKYGNIGRCEEGPHPVVPHDTMHRPCYRMAYAHDRDAIPFVFPKDVGVRIGKGTPYTRIVQEWHYLLPKNGLGENQFTDRTRFKVTLTKNLRKHNAAMIGVMNMRMSLPPGKKAVHHSWECDAARVKKLLHNDFEKYGSVKVMAVHLHAHNRGKALWWDHLRNGKKIGRSLP